VGGVSPVGREVAQDGVDGNIETALCGVGRVGLLSQGGAGLCCCTGRGQLH
jgi:hypothetical protein